MSLLVKNCEKRYKGLRGVFGRTVRNGKQYCYHDEMLFLLPYMCLPEDVFKGIEDDFSNDHQQDNSTMDVAMESEEDLEEKKKKKTGKSKAPDVKEELVVHDEDYTAAWTFPVAPEQEQVIPIPPTADKEIISAGDPLKLFFSSMYSSVKEMRAKNKLRVQKQIFEFVNEMQLKEAEEDDH